MIVLYVLIFLLGASLGSFYHVVGYRMPKKLNWIRGRSHCPHCGHQLRWFELIPLISYLWQRKRCKNCGSVINPIYFWVEFISGILFLIPVFHYENPFGNGTVFTWIFLSLLLIITVSDLYYQLILNKVLLFFLPLLLLYPNRSLIGMVGGICLLGANFVVGHLLFKRAPLGGGDIKLYGLVGLKLGMVSTVISLMIASILAAVFVAAVPNWRKKPLPFGPFISLASYIALLYGDSLWEFYLGLF